MNAVSAESTLALLYTASVVLSVISIVSLAVPWQHWRWTLDICLNMDCGCILYGETTFSTFMGGDVKVCTFAVYALIPVSVIAFSFGVYHGYRSCIQRTLSEPRLATQTTYRNNRNGREMIVVTPKHRAPYKQWMTTAFLAIMICCLCLSHAVVVTDGYYKTCEQYKRNLIKLLNAPSPVTGVIHNRLDCGAVLDYMDYLQPDANNWIRGEKINTRIALQLAVVTTWFNFFLWSAILVINFVMSKRHVKITDTLCCCCS